MMVIISVREQALNLLPNEPGYLAPGERGVDYHPTVRLLGSHLKESLPYFPVKRQVLLLKTVLGVGAFSRKTDLRGHIQKKGNIRPASLRGYEIDFVH
jgi:hypothetical protein